jgi:hydrogenase maturation protein HypF
MALSVMDQLGRLEEGAIRLDAADLARLMPRMAMPTTTSLGRVFDAAAGLLGLCRHQYYEGQAAMELEALVRSPRVMEAGYGIDDGVLSLMPLLSILADPSIDPVHGAELFHGTLIEALTAWIMDQATRLNLATIALGGGCLLNEILADGLFESLSRQGLRVLFPSKVPAGDGGLSLGQAYMGRFQKCA